MKHSFRESLVDRVGNSRWRGVLFKKASLRMATLTAAGLLVFSLLFASAPVRGVFAASVSVTSTADEVDAGSCATITTANLPGADGKTSLREAICAANNEAGSTVIDLPAGTYLLSAGEMQVGTKANTQITVHGTGTPANTIIKLEAGKSFRVFDVDPAVTGNVTFNLSNVTLQGGVGNLYGGGGILGGGTVDTDALYVSNCVITGNSTTLTNNGGGIAWNGGGIVSILNSTILNNTADHAIGGGIFIDISGLAGSVTITNTTFSGNRSIADPGAGAGGGLWLSLGSNTAVVNSSTFTNNIAETHDVLSPGQGGGVYLSSGNLTINHSFFTGNSAELPAGGGAGEGGAIYVSDGNLNLSFSRVTGNTAASGSGVFRNASASGAVTAVHDWWGCNAGPGNTGCDSTGGTVTSSPRLVLRHTANPNPILDGFSTTLTADFLQDSAAAPVSPADLSVLVGLPVTFNNPALGVISNAQPAVTSSGSATAKFTANHVPGAGSADATVDQQTVTAPITILPAQHAYLPLISK